MPLIVKSLTVSWAGTILHSEHIVAFNHLHDMSLETDSHSELKNMAEHVISLGQNTHW